MDAPAQKPVPLKPRLDAVPAALRGTASWVVWDYADRDGRWTKPPKRATGGGMAKTNDSSTWSTFEAAAAVAPLHDGVGLVLRDDLVGVDLDHVMDPDGVIEPWAAEVLQRFKGCYIERSPSGDGQRIFCRGKARRSGKGGPANRLEVYDKDSPRYLTYTGHKLGDGEVIEAQAALDWLHETYMVKKAAPKAEKGPTSPQGGLSDEEVLRKAREARNGAKFSRLWSGEAGDDPSTADAALIGVLSFWTKDPGQLDRLFRRSGLMREKWDEKRGATTYGRRTIAQVLTKNGETYKPPSEPRIGTKKTTADEAWPDFDPLPEVTERAPAAFPFEGLGPTMGAAARDIADAVQAPDAIAAGSVLAAASLAAQSHRNVVLPFGEEAPTSLFIVTSATSGDRKTGTDRAACRAINEQRIEDHKTYAIAKARHDAEMAERKKGDPTPPEPVQASLIISKFTVEGVLRLLFNQPHVGIFSAEGAEVFGGHSLREDRRTSGVAFMCKAWDGAVLDNNTGGDGARVLIGRRIAMHALVQPVVLKPLLTDAIADGQGFLARCLIAEPRSLAGTRLFPKDMVPARQRPAVAAFYGRIKALLEQAPPTDGDVPHQLDPKAMPLSPEARLLWIEFYDEVERQQAPGGLLEGVRAWASKAAEQAARIAAVIATVEGRSEVTANDMTCGMQVANFYLGEHVRLMGASVEDRHLRRLTTLLTWMKEQGRPVRHADILQKSPRPIRDQKAAGVNALLTELQQRGYIRRRGDSWEVHPDA